MWVRVCVSHEINAQNEMYVFTYSVLNVCINELRWAGLSIKMHSVGKRAASHCLWFGCLFSSFHFFVLVQWNMSGSKTIQNCHEVCPCVNGLNMHMILSDARLATVLRWDDFLTKFILQLPNNYSCALCVVDVLDGIPYSLFLRCCWRAVHAHFVRAVCVIIS